MISRAQLLELGASGSAISRSVAAGRLYRVHRAVYSTISPALRPPLAPEQAAIFAHGALAVLSHGSAARLHGLSGSFDDAVVHVTVIGAKRHQAHEGIAAHYAPGRLHPQEHHRLHGLPVTSVARTVLDLARHLDDRPLELFVDEVLVHRKTSRTKLMEVLERHAGRPGTARLRKVLDPSRPVSWTASPREERLLQMLRSARVALPETNVWLTPHYKPDLLWREPRVIVEYDSEEWHMGRRRFHGDRTRRNDLTATEGYQVLLVTKEHTPEAVLVWIAQSLARGRKP